MISKYDTDTKVIITTPNKSMLWCDSVEKLDHITYLTQNLIYIFSTFPQYPGYSIRCESTTYRKKFQIPRRNTSKAATMTSNAFWLKLGIDTLCNENTHANLKSVLTAYPPSMPKHVNNYSWTLVSKVQLLRLWSSLQLNAYNKISNV